MFWHGSPDGLGEKLLSGPLQDFERWCEDVLSEFPEDIDPDILPLLRAVQTNGRPALQAANCVEAALVDRLIETYFGMYCDGKQPEILISAERSMLSVWRYKNIFDKARVTPEFAQAVMLWDYIFIGRPIGRDPQIFPYQSADGFFHVSYWTFDEVVFLRNAIVTIALPNDVDASALQCSMQALDAAIAQRSGLIITIG